MRHILYVYAGPISALLAYLVSRLPDAAGAPMHAGQAARSGNVMGIDEGELAAEAAKKLTLAGSGPGGRCVRAWAMHAQRCCAATLEVFG